MTDTKLIDDPLEKILVLENEIAYCFKFVYTEVQPKITRHSFLDSFNVHVYSPLQFTGGVIRDDCGDGPRAGRHVKW